MGDLATILGARATAGAGGSTSIYPGVIELADDGSTVVNVAGRQLAPRWADPVIADVGDSVLVLVTGAAVGQSMAIVLSRIATAPRAPVGTVTAVPGGSTTITVSAGGASYSCRYNANYTPVVGDTVALLWNGKAPVVVCKLAATTSAYTPPPTGVKPPPSAPTSGVEKFAATDSGTWSVSAGGWSTTYGSELRQGTWDGRTYSGAWFYGNGPSLLAGKTITGARLRLGARARVGNYNDPLALDVYLHSHRNRGSSEPPRTAGPSSFLLSVNAPAQWVNIPTSFAQTIVTSGGGIAIAGAGYGGVAGRVADPESGLLEITWS